MKQYKLQDSDNYQMLYSVIILFFFSSNFKVF